MNFEAMWSVNKHSDLLYVPCLPTVFIQRPNHHPSTRSFWIIALPLMAIIIPVFLWSDLERMWHYFMKRVAVRSVKQVRMIMLRIA